jgi:hypothetical protein
MGPVSYADHLQCTFRVFFLVILAKYVQISYAGWVPSNIYDDLVESTVVICIMARRGQ